MSSESDPNLRAERRLLIANIKSQVWELIPFMDNSAEFFSLLSPLSPTEARLLLVYGAGPPSPYGWSTFQQSPWLELLHSNWNGLDGRIEELMRRFQIPPDCPGLSNCCGHLVSPAIALSRSLDLDCLDLFLRKYNIALDVHPNPLVQSSPLIETVKDFDAMIVHQLITAVLERGAHINSTPGNKKQTCLHVMLTRPRVSKDLFRFLLENGADMNIPDAGGNTCLHYIVEKGLYKLFPIISGCIESGLIKLQLLRNSENFTPLLASLYNADKRSCAFLLENCDLPVPTIRQYRYLNIICSEKKYIYRKRMRHTLVAGVKHGLPTGRVEHGYLKGEFCDAEKLSDIYHLTVTAVKLLINSYFYRDASVGMPNPILDIEMRRTCKRVCNRKYRKYNLGVANLTPIHQLTACCLQLFMEPFPGLRECSQLSEYILHKTDISRELYALIKVSSQFTDQSIFDALHPIVSEYFSVNIMKLLNHHLALSCTTWEELITVCVTYLWLCYEHVGLCPSSQEGLHRYIREILGSWRQFSGRRYSLVSSVIVAFNSPKLELCTNLREIVKISPQRLVEFLLEFGEDLNARGSDGTTPLHISIIYKDVELAQHLLELNADPYAVDYTDRTCLDYLNALETSDHFSLIPPLPTLKSLARDSILKTSLDYRRVLKSRLSDCRYRALLHFVNLRKPYRQLINIS